MHWVFQLNVPVAGLPGVVAKLAKGGGINSWPGACEYGAPSVVSVTTLLAFESDADTLKLISCPAKMQVSFTCANSGRLLVGQVLISICMSRSMVSKGCPYLHCIM